MTPFHAPWTMTIRRFLSAVLLTAPVLAVVATAPAARGGLITGIAYDQGLQASTNAAGEGSAMLVGTTLPVARTITVAEPVGYSTPLASASASYAFTDDGTTATFSINCSGNLNAPTSDVYENTVGATNNVGPGSIGDTYVTFAQPVMYTASLSATGMQFASLTLSTLIPSPLGPVQSQAGFLSVGYGGPAMAKATGVLPAGQRVYVTDLWELTNGTLTNPPPSSGTYSLQLTFTPVPEPASVGLAAIIGVALLARHRRSTVHR